MHRNSHTELLARILAHITLAGALALPVIAAAIWLFWDQLSALAAGQYGLVYDLASPGTGAKLGGFALFLAAALIQGYGLMGLRITFLEAAAGHALSDPAVNGFRRFAWVSFIMVFVALVQRTGLIMILSISDPEHPGALSIQFGTDELKAMFMALLLVFVAHVFSEAKRAKQENDSFL